MQSISPSPKTVAAIVIGGAIEWYDFIVYSLMTIYLAAVFFPSHDSTNSILATTATFGVAFFVRPVGASLLGLYADKRGRKSAMMLIIVLMSFALLMISMLPTYARVGVLAPLLLIVARVLQGFSASGECGTASALLYELAPVEHRGFYSSWQTVAQTSGMIVGAMVGTLLTTVLRESDIYAWAWRVPFILGLAIVPIGLYLRRQLSSQEEIFVKIQKYESSESYFYILKRHWPQLLIAVGLVAGGTATTYINLSYMATYAVKQLHLTMQTAFLVQFMCVSLLTLFVPVFGWLSDYIGSRKVFVIASISLYLLLVYPLFSWLNDGATLYKLIITQNILCFLLAPFFGVSTAMAAELFPIKIRAIALGLSSNLGVMMFGGFAQFMVTW